MNYLHKRLRLKNDVWSVEKYANYIVREYNSNFKLPDYPTLNNFEINLGEYEIELWNYPLCEMDLVAFDCDHTNFAIVAFRDYTPTGFEYRICEL